MPFVVDCATATISVPQFDVARVRAGDREIGSLPVHLAADVCVRGARYLHLSLDL
jgi:CRISPR-associated protein Csx16